jgi:hypothetical protein
MPEDLAELVRAHVGPGGFSAYVTAAVRERVAMDRLREIIDDHEATYGAFTAEEIARADVLLAGATDEATTEAAERRTAA